MKCLILLLACCATLSVVSAQSTEGTSFVVALPRTGGVFEGLVRMTARVATDFTIESATGTEAGTIPAGGTFTVTYPMSQRLTSGVENVGLIVTATNPISVHLDQPSWELDVAMARPIDADDTNFYVVNYLGDDTGSSFEPLSFYFVAASEDNTRVELFNDDRSMRTVVVLNKFDVYSVDASEEGIQGGDIDYTGVHVTADKPVSVMAGHGRVLFPDNNNYQYIFDSMPNTAELGTSYTTFPILYGSEGNGYMVRAVGASNGTQVNIPSLGVSTTINAGEYYQEEHRSSSASFKVDCTPACYVAEFPVASFVSGGSYDTTMGGAMIPLTADSDFSSSDLLVSLPFLNDPANAMVALAVISSTYPVSEVYVNGENVNTAADGGWMDGGGYGYASVPLSTDTGMVTVTSLAGEQIAAYLYNNVPSTPAGTKAYSAGVP